MMQKHCNGAHRPVYRQRAIERFTGLHRCVGRQRNLPPCPRGYNNTRLMRFLVQYPGKRIFRKTTQPEKAEETMTILRNLLLTHWEKYHPMMFAQLKKENRLEAELEETANQFSDLMYELTMVKNMSYSSAWEMPVDQ